MKNKILQIFLLSIILIVVLSNNIFAGVNVDAGNGEEAGNYTFNGTKCNFVNHAAF